jgi:hypothetical protein
MVKRTSTPDSSERPVAISIPIISIVYSACIPWAKTIKAKKKSENEIGKKKKTKLAATVEGQLRV